jgi:hypothetical protein
VFSCRRDLSRRQSLVPINENMFQIRLFWAVWAQDLRSQ